LIKKGLKQIIQLAKELQKIKSKGKRTLTNEPSYLKMKNVQDLKADDGNLKLNSFMNVVRNLDKDKFEISEKLVFHSHSQCPSHLSEFKCISQTSLKNLEQAHQTPKETDMIKKQNHNQLRKINSDTHKFVNIVPKLEKNLSMNIAPVVNKLPANLISKRTSQNYIEKAKNNNGGNINFISQSIYNTDKSLFKNNILGDNQELELRSNISSKIYIESIEKKTHDNSKFKEGKQFSEFNIERRNNPKIKEVKPTNFFNNFRKRF